MDIFLVTMAIPIFSLVNEEKYYLYCALLLKMYWPVRVSIQCDSCQLLLLFSCCCRSYAARHARQWLLQQYNPLFRNSQIRPCRVFVSETRRACAPLPCALRTQIVSVRKFFSIRAQLSQLDLKCKSYVKVNSYPPSLQFPLMYFAMDPEQKLAPNLQHKSG